MCVSQLSESDRREVKRVVENYGGTFATSLDLSRCTHLVTENHSSEKYAAAKANGTIQIVNISWIRACVKVKSKNLVGGCTF